MTDEIRQNYGKPTAYLDQNILDMFVKDGSSIFFEKIKSSFQVVYSDETLKEIRRSGDSSSKFITLLQKIDAFHLKPILEQPGFIATDNATLTKRDPEEAYQEYCNNNSEQGDVGQAMVQWLYKFSGGRGGDDFSVIHKEQKQAFSKLMEKLKIHLSELSEKIPNLEQKFSEYENQMTNQLADSLDELESLMRKNISDEKSWSGIRSIRNAIGIGPKELNNITPPNVLQKIWELFRVRPPYNAMNVEIDEFYCLTKNHPDRPLLKHQKVTAIYNMLNTLGYHPDSQIHKERRFISSLSDTGHAAMASFCNVLLSRDEAFVKKVSAAYKYLAIPTLVIYVSIGNT